MKDEDFSELRIQKSEATPIPQGKPAAAAPAPQNAQKVPPEVANPVEYAVMRPVAGGLQPIIAPRGQVQLNPVVVPVAFVPYATQNQPVLQIDNKPKQQQPLPEVKDQPDIRARPRYTSRRNAAIKSPSLSGMTFPKKMQSRKRKPKTARLRQSFSLSPLDSLRLSFSTTSRHNLKSQALRLPPASPISLPAG